MQPFAVTWDYRCPFARNAHEHVLAGLADGADWDVRFVPFSLSQAHVEEGETDVWDDPERDSGLLALQVGVVVRDWFPEQFPAVHGALFALRHDKGQSLKDEALLRAVLTEAGVDADVVFDEIATGKPLALVKAEHTEAVAGRPRVGRADVRRRRPVGLRPAHGPPGGRHRRSAAGPSSGCSTS